MVDATMHGRWLDAGPGSQARGGMMQGQRRLTPGGLGSWADAQGVGLGAMPQP